jgi:hypothetical protein
VTNVRKGLDTILATAPQLTKRQRWGTLMRYIVAKIIAAKTESHSQTPLSPSNFSPQLVQTTG